MDIETFTRAVKKVPESVGQFGRTLFYFTILPIQAGKTLIPSASTPDPLLVEPIFYFSITAFWFLVINGLSDDLRLLIIGWPVLRFDLHRINSFFLRDIGWLKIFFCILPMLVFIVPVGRSRRISRWLGLPQRELSGVDAAKEEDTRSSAKIILYSCGTQAFLFPWAVVLQALGLFFIVGIFHFHHSPALWRSVLYSAVCLIAYGYVFFYPYIVWSAAIHSARSVVGPPSFRRRAVAVVILCLLISPACGLIGYGTVELVRRIVPEPRISIDANWETAFIEFKSPVSGMPREAVLTCRVKFTINNNTDKSFPFTPDELVFSLTNADQLARFTEKKITGLEQFLLKVEKFGSGESRDQYTVASKRPIAFSVIVSRPAKELGINENNWDRLIWDGNVEYTGKSAPVSVGDELLGRTTICSKPERLFVVAPWPISGLRRNPR